MRCDEAATTLTELAEGAEPTSPAAARHISRCLRCQAQLAQHRRVRRSLRSLRDRTVEPQPGLLGEILGSLEAQAAGRGATTSRRRRVLACGTAIGAAGAATVVGAWLLVGHARRSPAPAAAVAGA